MERGNVVLALPFFFCACLQRILPADPTLPPSPQQHDTRELSHTLKMHTTASCQPPLPSQPCSNFWRLPKFGEGTSEHPWLSSAPETPLSPRFRHPHHHLLFLLGSLAWPVKDLLIWGVCVKKPPDGTRSTLLETPQAFHLLCCGFPPPPPLILFLRPP